MNPTLIISLIDLTSLNDSDTTTTITQLCQSAITPLGKVAAVCVYPQFVAHANQCLQNKGIKIATVVNFPSGDQSLEMCLNSIERSIHAGADEIDVVLPYRGFLAGHTQQTKEFLIHCRQACPKPVVLKVILETGELKEAEMIKSAAIIAIQAGADFVKTSTGKTTVGATLPAAESILKAILEQKASAHTGIKLSGGIRTLEQANEYLQLIEQKMGASWISAQHVRLGASQLLKEVLKCAAVT